MNGDCNGDDDSDGVDDGAYGDGDDNEDIMLMMH